MRAFRMSYENNHPLFGVKSLLVAAVISPSCQCEQQDLCRVQTVKESLGMKCMKVKSFAGDDSVMSPVSVDSFDFSAADGDGLSHMAQWRRRQLCWGTQDVHNDNERFVY